jgi:hypothetical protein
MRIGFSERINVLEREVVKYAFLKAREQQSEDLLIKQEIEDQQFSNRTCKKMISEKTKIEELRQRQEDTQLILSET